MASPILRYFEYKHLPPKLQVVSEPIGELARHMDLALPEGPEKSAGLRKLLEAKDCLVRAALDAVAPAAKSGNPIAWNPFNKVVQDHRDGEIDHEATNRERIARGLPVPWTGEIGVIEVHRPPVY